MKNEENQTSENGGCIGPILLLILWSLVACCHNLGEIADNIRVIANKP